MPHTAVAQKPSTTPDNYCVGQGCSTTSQVFCCFRLFGGKDNTASSGPAEAEKLLKGIWRVLEDDSDMK